MKEESAKRRNSKYCEVCVSSKINISQYLAIISVSPRCKRKICQLWPNWSGRNLAKRIFYPGNWDSCWWVFCVSNNHLSPVKESFSWIQSQANVKTPFIRSTVRYASTKIKAFLKPPLLGFLASKARASRAIRRMEFLGRNNMMEFRWVLEFWSWTGQKATTDAVWAQSKADNEAKNCIFTQYEFLNLNISICKMYHDTCSLDGVWEVEILMLKIAFKDFQFIIPLARSCVHNTANTKVKCIDCTKCIFCILWICVCTCVHVISGFVTCARRQCIHWNGRLSISLHMHFRKSFKQSLTRPPSLGHIDVCAFWYSFEVDFSLNIKQELAT